MSADVDGLDMPISVRVGDTSFMCAWNCAQYDLIRCCDLAEDMVAINEAVQERCTPKWWKRLIQLFKK